MTNVVIVESPAKAKTINKYLGKDFTIVASFGHVRDLPSKQGSVKPDQDFAMEWQVDEKSQKHIKNIISALKGAKNLYLATDPDREGEAISWHIAQILAEQKRLKDVDIKRIAFNEITKNAVQEALRQPRDLNQELIDAYLARRALDYLVGFTLSPILWRRLPGSKSAGRVQSVALRLVCEREEEIEKFKSQEYWSIVGQFETDSKEAFTAKLTHLQSKKLDKFDLKTKAEVDEVVPLLKESQYHVANVEKKQVKRNPMPPFSTSTLQQEASRRLYFGATKTMRTAQRLYEGVEIGGETVGLITYMRTDSVQLSQEAIQSCRKMIDKLYGKNYVPSSPRVYKTKAKNAQEAHEAIRPTDLSRTPDQVKPYLEESLYKLYDLIWRRTMACEMESAVFDQVTVDIADQTQKNQFRAVGSTLIFDGFLKVYKDLEERKKSDDEKDQDNEGQNRLLPPLAVQDRLQVQDIIPNQHFTQPPPRYSEASLVKKLEELGIGRPSTYATILQVLQDRDYVRLEKRRFFPQERGRLVTIFLKNYFEKYVEYDFTAQLEEQLDDISGGRMDWKKVLTEFWNPFNQAAEDTLSLSMRDVLERLNEELADHLFPETEDGKDPRVCPSCDDGQLGLKLGKYGMFIGCSNYPDCRYTRKIEEIGEEGAQGEEGTSGAFEPRILGFDPETQAEISIRKGPYGFYVQATQADQEEKPKRSSFPRGYDPASIDLEQALSILALPRELGKHPDTGQKILAGIGRYGPYLKHGASFQSLGPSEDVLTIGLNRAVTILAEGKSKAGRHLGDHPEDGQPIHVLRGRFGPYMKHGKTNVPIPKSEDPDSLDLNQAVEIIAAYQAKPKKPKRAAKKKAK